MDGCSSNPGIAFWRSFETACFIGMGGVESMLAAMEFDLEPAPALVVFLFIAGFTWPVGAALTQYTGGDGSL